MEGFSLSGSPKALSNAEGCPLQSRRNRSMLDHRFRENPGSFASAPAGPTACCRRRGGSTRRGRAILAPSTSTSRWRTTPARPATCRTPICGPEICPGTAARRPRRGRRLRAFPRRVRFGAAGGLRQAPASRPGARPRHDLDRHRPKPPIRDADPALRAHRTGFRGRRRCASITQSTGRGRTMGNITIRNLVSCFIIY